ncbi:MAG: DUF2812 domain-containing protein [Lysinibacillus sp.]
MKKLKLFWGYRIEETEEWLEQMAGKGWLLKEFRPLLRTFTFKPAEPRQLKYHIDYKTSDDGRLEQAGWKTMAKTERWTFRSAENPQLYPGRDSLFKRFRLHMYSILSVLSIAFPFLLLPLVIFSLLIPIEPAGIHLFFLLAVSIGEMVLILWVYTFFRKQERKLLGLPTMRKSQKTNYRKLRIGWFYDPYHTKKWLQKMFDEGYEIEKAGAMWFYFTPRQAEAIRYEIIYENRVDPIYYQLHEAAGWRLVHTSSTSLMNSTLWAMPHAINEEPPAITYDMEERKRIVKRNFTMTTTIFFILTLSSSFSTLNYIFIEDDPFSSLEFLSFTSALNIVLLIMWLVLYVKSFIGYSREMREMHDS